MIMKTLTIGTKSQASKILVNSLFVGGGTLNDGVYCAGKYKCNPDLPYLGRQVSTSDDVMALYTVSKSDSHGRYVQIRCITK